MQIRPFLMRKAFTTPSRDAIVPSFLVPFVHQRFQIIRSASILSSLSNVKSSYNKRIRRGRGPASGKGKTAGRGHKGQKQHGKVPAGFNGGQTPDHVVQGQRGFVNTFALDMAKVNVDRIQDWIDQGRLDNTQPITLKELLASRCAHQIKDGIKLLGRNASKLRSPINITVSRASASAIAAVEAAGGTIVTRYYTQPAIKRILKGEMHPTLSFLSAPVALDSNKDDSIAAGLGTSATSPKSASELPMTAFQYRLPDPASREDLEYYRDPAHRGYLSYQLKEGEGPSLFFRTPQQKSLTGRKGVTKKKKAKQGSATSDNNLW